MLKAFICVHKIGTIFLTENYYVWQLSEFTQREIMHENLDTAMQPIYRLDEIENTCS
jgi:hypothetical protein